MANSFSDTDTYNSFEEWLSNPLPQNKPVEFNEDFTQPKNKSEAFRRYGVPGESFYRAIREAEFLPKEKDGGIEISYNPAFKSIDTNKAWQLWLNGGQPIVKDKGLSHTITDSDSTDISFGPKELARVNNVLKSTGASIVHSEGNPLLASMIEATADEEEFVDNRTQKEKDVELFQNASEIAYDTIGSAMEILTEDSYPHLKET